MNFLNTLQAGAAQGLWWAVMTLGVYISYRVLDAADLTVEGSFPLGAAVSVVCINAGMNPFLALLVAFVAGCLAGAVTGMLNTICRIPPILAGILTMIALYSVNIRIMSDRASITIAADSARTLLMHWLPITNGTWVSILGGIVTNALLVAVLYLFFGTEIGCAMRATGQNIHMARAMGIHTRWMTILGLMLSNGLVALSGSFVAQFDYGSAMATMGQGAIVIGLASVIIGEVLFCHKDRSFAFKLIAVVLGAVIYRCIIALALQLDFLKATDLKLITAVIVVFALSLPVLKKQFAQGKLRRENERKLNGGGGTEHA